MLPVDATPFLPAGADPRTPLILLDAATLKYESSNIGLADNAPQHELRANASFSALRRLTPSDRAERWRSRLPLLDEDPLESELPRRPPGEEAP